MFDFNQINLIPQRCIVSSRSECNTQISIGKNNLQFNIPVIPANMECVINDEIAELLATNGYFYIHHRFNVDAIQFAQNMKNKGLFISISIGVGDEAYRTLRELIAHNLIPDFITIDIAHGHSDSMESLLKWINIIFTGDTRPYIIAGNVSTPEAVQDLEIWGADAIKVGIGPGSACTTYTATGFGSRGIQASIIRECSLARLKSNTVIIADGGIKEPGDIVKAITLGADFVMVGGMFSGLTDAPGNMIIDSEGRKFKEFWGSASAHQSGKTNRIEGTKKLMPLKDRCYMEEMNYLKECLQSAISYGGGTTLHCLKCVKFIVKQLY
jgi:GMP reductase